MIAKDLASSAERAGADGLLLLPPSLTEFECGGLAQQVEAVCKSTRLGVIFYSRANAPVDESTLQQLCERCPNLVGFKDGVGDIEWMTRIDCRRGSRLTLIRPPSSISSNLPEVSMRPCGGGATGRRCSRAAAEVQLLGDGGEATQLFQFEHRYEI